MTRILLLIIALAGPAAGEPLSSGIERFFKGDLDAAVTEWVSAHESGNRAAKELARLGMKILAKDALQAGDSLGARVHIAHGLEFSPADKELEALFKLADAESPFQRGAPERSLDSTPEREALIRRVLELDLEMRPKRSTGKTASPKPPLVSELFPARKKFHVDDLLASMANAEQAAVARAKVSVAWHKRRARFRYEQGLTSYYGGDYGAAAEYFRQALKLDPALKEARSGLASAEALEPPGRQAEGKP